MRGTFMTSCIHKIGTKPSKPWCIISVPSRYDLIFVCRRQLFFWQSGKRKAQDCFCSQVLRTSSLKWGNGKETTRKPSDYRRPHSERLACTLILYFVLCFCFRLCVHVQGSGAATGERCRKERAFPRQGQQPGEESRGWGFASGTQPPALSRRGVRDEQVDPGALTAYSTPSFSWTDDRLSLNTSWQIRILAVLTTTTLFVKPFDLCVIRQSKFNQVYL